MITTVEKVLFLKSIDLFRALPGEELAQIAEIAEEVAALPERSFEVVIMHSVSQYLSPAQLDTLLAQGLTQSVAVMRQWTVAM